MEYILLGIFIAIGIYIALVVLALVVFIGAFILVGIDMLFNFIRDLFKRREMSNLTENLRGWRKDRNITKADYLTFVGNILEELLEPIYTKDAVNEYKKGIIIRYFDSSFIDYKILKEKDIIDTIQDIQVFCINETELMGYDNIKCNNEVFKHINCRKQDPTQKDIWSKTGANEKWLKDINQNPNEIYEPNYESCKL